MKLWIDANARAARCERYLLSRIGAPRARGVIVIDPRGEEYTAQTIGERLSVRNFMDALRGSVVETGGHAAFSARDKQAFANALDRALTRARRPG